MTQNEINKQIRITIIQLFGQNFIDSVESFDTYRFELRNKIKILEYSKILDNTILFENFKNEIEEICLIWKLSEPIILKNTEKSLIELDFLNKEISKNYEDDFENMLNKNYLEIESFILEKIKTSTGKIPDESLNLRNFINEFWMKSCKLTLKKFKKNNFNYFQDHFLNKKYESIIETIHEINFN